MALPQMHGRTHIPKGYAAVVQPAADAALLPQSTSDQLRCIAGGAWTGDSAFMEDSTISGTGTVSNNTLTDIIMDQISIASGSSAFTTRSALNSATPLKALLDGWYFFYLNFEWAGTPYTDVRTYSLFVNNFPDNCGDDDVVHSESSPFINAAFNGTFGPLYFRPSQLSDFWWKVRVQHSSGGTETIAGVELTCLYLGPDLDAARFPPF